MGQVEVQQSGLLLGGEHPGRPRDGEDDEQERAEQAVDRGLGVTRRVRRAHAERLRQVVGHRSDLLVEGAGDRRVQRQVHQDHRGEADAPQQQAAAPLAQAGTDEWECGGAHAGTCSGAAVRRSGA